MLRAVQVVVDENLARPTLIGRPEVIEQRIAKFGLRLQAERDYDLVNTEDDHRYRDYWQTYHQHDGAQGRDRAARQDRDAPPPDADRRDAAARPARSTACSAAPGARTAMHLQLHRPGDRPARRRQDLRLHERADPARPPGDAGRHPRQLRPDAPSSSPRSRSWRPRRCCASACKPKAALLSHSNFGTSNQPSAREDARGAGDAAGAGAPGSRSTARCTATPRSTPTTGTS